MSLNMAADEESKTYMRIHLVQILFDEFISGRLNRV